MSRATQSLDKETLRYRNNHATQRAYQDYKAAEYKARNEKDWREARRASVRKHREKVKALIYQLLGGPKCVRCGFDDERALQIDHIHGAGTRGRNERGVHREYADILRWGREKFQVLCANCNWIKRKEDGEQANLDKRNTGKETR